MKTPIKFMIAFGMLLLMQSGTSAQTYRLDWSTVDGGGGTSTGDVYSVSGTIGQPDAGTMSGGNYSLQGGFWSMFAVQTPDAPHLSIRQTNGQVIVFWPAPAESWLLERTNVLTGVAGPWWQVPPPYQTSAGVLSVTFTNTPPAGNWFFRLHKP